MISTSNIVKLITIALNNNTSYNFLSAAKVTTSLDEEPTSFSFQAFKPRNYSTSVLQMFH